MGFNKIDMIKLSKKQINAISEENERLMKKYSEKEFEELTGLMAIIVNSRKPQSENWKRLKEIISK